MESQSRIESWRAQVKQIKEAEKKKSLFTKIKPRLMRYSSFYSQLPILMAEIQPNEMSLIRKTDDTCRGIKKMLEKSFPNCEAIPFGSSVTGLALIDSDLDVYLLTNESIVDDNNSQTTIHGTEKIWTQKLIFREVKTCLYKNRNIIKNIVPIGSAITPVIKFHYIPTDTDVDITFKNSLGVHKSNLIKFCLNLDSRIKPLIMIIKFWGKELHLTGGRKITNYFVLMMIFYYLQQPDISLIPKINVLQSNCEKIIYEGWQVNFNQDYPKTTSNCNKTISQLLCGFYKFYSTFDFTSRVICPLYGTAPLRNDFLNSTLGQKYNFDFSGLTESASLHDPIKLDYVIKGWSPIRLNNFIVACKQAYEKCCQSSDNSLDMCVLLDMTLYENLVQPVHENLIHQEDI
ncbi:speckle targeted PIP5K1A-regulated poly(A) polymerase-like [Aphidius gifuensis]|uniref:speckle targeted PIP5K1A-regulated poly(A) polymerase-like n=1 Tax=Aphidius gifuensis TaxID=684658 RepID=UPI001CDD25E4|nr:speckle targeted PIP5K1A-regulated poly(A) polymerase-like [Aphidius gifuensis]